MATLKDRKFKLLRKEDVNEKNLEGIFTDMDDRFRSLDQRRITQQSEMETNATLSDVITTLNNLISALNSSELTEEN